VLALTGHGWGHGKGLGQWGALGYALSGQGYAWILSHYYGGTTLTTVPAVAIRVRMVENDGNDVIVTSASAFTAAGVPVPAGHAARLHLTTTPHTWQLSTAPSCAGPWTAAGQATDDSAAVTPTMPAAVAQPASAAPNAPASALLQLCLPGGNTILRGSIAANEVAGVPRTVNVLPMESYLQGVVSSESPAYWGNLGAVGAQGEPEGFQALEAQAVAARTYSLSDKQSNGGAGEYSYADVCDTTACQVYRGYAAETTISNLAVADTAGQIMALSTGAAAFTEFSASTGGWTAGGDFPSVVDSGDSVCVASACNPNHSWSTSVPVSSIESAYPALGVFQSAAVTQRTGPAQADFGGRASEVELSGSAGTVTITGNTFAAQFGLKSNWFGFTTGAPTAGSTTTTSSTTTSTSTTTTTPTSTTTTAAGPTTSTTLPSYISAVRVAGIDRIGTAIAASELAYPADRSAQAVVLARADDYADALAGAPLAAKAGGPLLLTGPHQLDPTVLTELVRVAVPGTTVYVLGGTAAVSPAIDSTLTSAGYRVVRIEGDDRYATAVAVAHEMGNPHAVFEVTGTNFPDGLVAAPAAITQGAAILLTSGPKQSAETAAYLAAHPTDVRYAIGGPASQADRSASAITGADRYATAVSVARRFFSHPAVVGVATGSDFPDALAAGPALGSTGPLLLLPPSVPAPLIEAQYLAGLGPVVRSLDVFGGTTAVGQGSLLSLARAIP
jgi:SpoIID/LytB domain protein